MSFTPVRNLEQYGASTVGFGALYLLVGAIGAQADLAALAGSPDEAQLLLQRLIQNNPDSPGRTAAEARLRALQAAADPVAP